MCPAFSLTDYKVQSQTLTEALLDLRDDNSIRVRDTHRKFCSFIVQLSRIRSLHGLHLLQPIQMSDLNLQPHEDMLKTTNFGKPNLGKLGVRISNESTGLLTSMTFRLRTLVFSCLCLIVYFAS